MKTIKAVSIIEDDNTCKIKGEPACVVMIQFSCDDLLYTDTVEIKMLKTDAEEFVRINTPDAEGECVDLISEDELTCLCNEIEQHFMQPKSYSQMMYLLRKAFKGITVPKYAPEHVEALVGTTVDLTDYITTFQGTQPYCECGYCLVCILTGHVQNIERDIALLKGSA